MADENDSQGALTEIAGTVGEFLGGVPAPVQKSFWKVAHRVLVGGAEVPAAKLESWAQDIRTRQKARDLIVMESAKAAAARFKKDPELAVRALSYHASDIVDQQINREEILKIAKREVEQKKDVSKAGREIEDDWLSVFLREASLASSEGMRVIYGKILAEEIVSPGSFSKRSVITLSLMDKPLAEQFQTLCKYVFDFGSATSYMFCEQYEGDPGQNNLASLGLSFSVLSSLEAAGLIASNKIRM